MLTGIVVLQIVLSITLFLVLWHFLTPITLQFVAVLDEREKKSKVTEEEHFETRGELRKLTSELSLKRQEQRARGVKIRESIIDAMKSDAQSAQTAANERAESDLQEFKGELVKLKEKLNRDVEEEAKALSNLILEKVSVGSGMNPNAIH
jgi:F0F1-type ATP synthase membrane subunit b/b'